MVSHRGGQPADQAAEDDPHRARMLRAAAPRPENLARKDRAPRWMALETSVHRIDQSSSSRLTGRQVLSGLKSSIFLNSSSVFAPRSFSYTTPSLLTMNVMTPVTRYSAGAATSANPPIIAPFTT